MTSALEPSLDRSPVPDASDRSFGYVFAAVFAFIGASPLLRLDSPRWWALAIALAFTLVASVRPQTLHPLNRVWMAFGHLLHKVMNPLVLGAIYFLCVTPTGWIIRLKGKDLLSLKRQSDLDTYWIERTMPPQAQSMKNQF